MRDEMPVSSVRPGFDRGRRRILLLHGHGMFHYQHRSHLHMCLLTYSVQKSITALIPAFLGLPLALAGFALSSIDKESTKVITVFHSVHG